MKKRGLTFTVLASIWLIIFDSLILNKVIKEYILERSVIPVRENFITGNFIMFPPTTSNIITKIAVPLLIYNFLIILFLSMHYKYKNKLFKIKTKSNKIHSSKKPKKRSKKK